MHQLQRLPILPAFPGLALLTEASDLDTDLAEAEARVRAQAAREAVDADRHITAFLGEIEELSACALREPDAYRELLDALIEDARDGERDFKRDLQQLRRLTDKLIALLVRVSPDRRDLGRFAAGELMRLTGRYIAALQEARWMLMAARAELEKGGPGQIASTPEELSAILRQAG
jgi:hypothetical protein